MTAFCVSALLLIHTAQAADSYSVSGFKVLKNGAPAQWRGANAFHRYGGNSSDMSAWHIDIVREVIGDISETPISGGPIQDHNGSWIYSLQSMADNNLANGKVTIFCPFSWDWTSGTTFSGMNPSSASFWSAYKTKLQAWANQFKTRSDVWIELWNEPYSWNGANGYTQALWLSDMQAMVDNIRATGNTNIILVPCGKQGGDETVITAKGPTLLSGRSNLVFDVHAYNGWIDQSQTSIENRIAAVRAAGCAIVFCETGPITPGGTMDPSTFLYCVANKGVTTLAWDWTDSDSDGNALLHSNGTLNNTSNFNWGSTYQAFATATHSPAANYETEVLSVPNYLSQAGGTVRIITGDANFSNSQGSILDSNNVGDYVTYLLPNVPAGSYDVTVGVKKFTSRGQFQLQVGRADSFSTTASNVGPVVDEYASTSVYTSVDLGTWSPGSTSDKWFRFNVAGKNSASTGSAYNYAICIDYIKLTPQ